MFCSYHQLISTATAILDYYPILEVVALCCDSASQKSIGLYLLVIIDVSLQASASTSSVHSMQSADLVPSLENPIVIALTVAMSLSIR